MSLLEKIKDTFSDPYDDEDEEYLDEEEEEAEAAPVPPTRQAPVAPAPVSSRTVAPRRPASAQVPTARTTAASVRPYTMVVVNPRDYKDAEKIADHIKSGRPVVMNMESANADAAARIVDFVQGVMYALDGHMDSVGEQIFLCAPNNMSVSRENFAAYASGVSDGSVPRFNFNE